jgi:hypothetical protein
VPGREGHTKISALNDIVQIAGWSTTPSSDQPVVGTLRILMISAGAAWFPNRQIAKQAVTRFTVRNVGTRNYLRPVRGLANDGAAVILIHHNGKSETSKQYRGSSAILGEIDAGLLISNKSDRPGLGVLEVKPFKARVLGQGISKFRYMHRRGFEADYGAGAPTSSHEEQLTELLRHITLG